MAIINKIRKSRGFTLVELMIVVVIIGILAALAIFGVRRYVTNSKSAEARMAIGRMGKDAAAMYEGEKMAGGQLGLGSSVGTSRKLCLSATASVPTATQGEGTKYQAKPSEWRAATPDYTVGWDCLKFSMEQPIYFRYNYQSNATAGAAAKANDAFTASAEAALDGGFKQIFINGVIKAEGTNLILTVSPSLCESDSTATKAAIQDYDGNCTL